MADTVKLGVPGNGSLVQNGIEAGEILDVELPGREALVAGSLDALSAINLASMVFSNAERTHLASFDRANTRFGLDQEFCLDLATRFVVLAFDGERVRRRFAKAAADTHSVDIFAITSAAYEMHQSPFVPMIP